MILYLYCFCSIRWFVEMAHCSIIINDIEHDAYSFILCLTHLRKNSSILVGALVSFRRHKCQFLLKYCIFIKVLIHWADISDSFIPSLLPIFLVGSLSNFYFKLLYSLFRSKKKKIHVILQITVLDQTEFFPF